jgi:hypothetical protein
MTASERGLLSQMDDYTLDGKFHEATEAFCRLAAGGHDVRQLVTHIMSTAAPYLHVPAHEKLLPNGEFRNVNYDHTSLGIRAGMRLAPYLAPAEQHLPLVQGIYYVPQGPGRLGPARVRLPGSLRARAGEVRRGADRP